MYVHRAQTCTGLAWRVNFFLAPIAISDGLGKVGRSSKAAAGGCSVALGVLAIEGLETWTVMAYELMAPEC